VSIRRGFVPGCVDFKTGALDSQLQVIKFTSCLPMVGGSLWVLRLPPSLKLVAMIIAEIFLKVALNTINQIKSCHWATRAPQISMVFKLCSLYFQINSFSNMYTLLQFFTFLPEYLSCKKNQHLNEFYFQSFLMCIWLKLKQLYYKILANNIFSSS
jgi:hypothetical protein